MGGFLLVIRYRRPLSSTECPSLPWERLRSYRRGNPRRSDLRPCSLDVRTPFAYASAALAGGPVRAETVQWLDEEVEAEGWLRSRV